MALYRNGKKVERFSHGGAGGILNVQMIKRVLRVGFMGIRMYGNRPVLHVIINKG